MPGREVERSRDIGAPVEHEGRALAVVLPDSDTTDVVVPAVGELQATETETVFPRVQGGKQTGLFGDQHIPLQPRLEPAPDIGQRAAHRAFGLVTQAIEAGVDPVDELLLDTEFFG